jgi:hypothetical protein
VAVCMTGGMVLQAYRAAVVLCCSAAAHDDGLLCNQADVNMCLDRFVCLLCLHICVCAAVVLPLQLGNGGGVGCVCTCQLPSAGSG